MDKMNDLRDEYHAITRKQWDKEAQIASTQCMKM